MLGEERMGSEGTGEFDVERCLFNRQIDWGEESAIGAVFFGSEKARQFPPLPRGPLETARNADHVDPTEGPGNAPEAGRLLNWAEVATSTYEEEQLEVRYIGHLTAPKHGHRVKLEGMRIDSPGELPELIEEETVEAFDPDYFISDLSFLEMRWD